MDEHTWRAPLTQRPRRRYIPALDYDWLTPAYDALIRLTMPERAFKRRLIEQAQMRAGHALLDLGCGTATLAIMAKGKPHDALMWLASWSVRLVDGPTTADNVTGRLPQLCREAGFDAVEEPGRFATVFGTLSLHGARKPPSAS